jgi:hypothetical protein
MSRVFAVLVSIGALAACASAPRQSPVYIVGALEEAQAHVVVSAPDELHRAVASVEPEVLVVEASLDEVRTRDPWRRDLPQVLDHRRVSSPFLRPEVPRVYAARAAELPALVQRVAAEHSGQRILVVVRVDHRAQVSQRLRSAPSIHLVELQQVSSVP